MLFLILLPSSLFIRFFLPSSACLLASSNFNCSLCDGKHFLRFCRLVLRSAKMAVANDKRSFGKCKRDNAAACGKRDGFADEAVRCKRSADVLRTRAEERRECNWRQHKRREKEVAIENRLKQQRRETVSDCKCASTDFRLHFFEPFVDTQVNANWSFARLREEIVEALDKDERIACLFMLRFTLEKFFDKQKNTFGCSKRKFCLLVLYYICKREGNIQLKNGNK